MTGSVEVGAIDILLEALLLVVAAVGAVALYRAMRKPRLRLVSDDAGRVRATRRDVVQYALSMPVLVLLWNLMLGAVLILTPTDMSGARIIIVSAAVILATRFLAHVATEPAHELAKAIPLTLVVLVLIRGQTRSPDSFQDLSEGLSGTTETLAAQVLVFTADYVFTACWYWIGVRYLVPRGRSVPGLPAGCRTGPRRPLVGDGIRRLPSGRRRISSHVRSLSHLPARRRPR